MTYTATSSDLSPSSPPPPSGPPPNTRLPTPESALRPIASDTEGESDAPSAPVFRAHLIDDMGSEADVDEAGITSDEECTKKSFDYTGELRCLNESGASDRRSFVEQLENAFKTPAKIDLKCLGGRLGLGESFLMPLPALPTVQRPTAPAIPPPPPPSVALPAQPNVTEDSAAFEVTGDMIMDVNLENSIQQIDLSEASKVSDRLSDHPPIVLRTHASQPHLRSVGSKASDGQLNKDFRFGGKPAQKAELKPVDEQPAKPLTLSDIIPPPSHPSRSPSMSFSMLEEDSSILKSIYAKATELQAARQRVNSDSSSKRHARQVASHKRHSSELSFSGLSSFGEVRRGFEFGPDRPAFYPPSQSQSYLFSRNHGRHESVFSIASVSSYGMVINSGSIDPFDYGLPPRPLSMDASVSFDDTFSFLNREPRRRRVDSDASSFYFNSHSQNSHIPRRRHRHNDSSASVMSAAPPISLYNRSFGAHRRNDSSTSASSLAHAYGTYGANGGRAAWARHQQDHSIDSVISDFSAVRLGRPGLGDKMLESARDYAVPLTAISASPPGSDKSSREVGHQTSFDSIMDEDPRSSGDSIFDATGQRTSMSSDSVFGYDDHHPPSQGMGLFPPNQFRPLSVISIPTVRSPINEDDTMISMLAGGRVRRRSIGSLVEASPCVRAEKRMHDGNPMRVPLKGLRMCQDEDSIDASPDKARLIEKVSITSGSSHKFGGERMSLAQKGMLDRQSLELGCLSADGEDLSASNLSRPVFRRPALANRSLPDSRPESYVISSGADTPPLSVSDGSSQSSGSQSSIDLGRLNVLLTNATHPVSNAAMARSRARARGNGHRRRVSQAPASRTSVYETIEEEVPGLSHSHSPSPVKLSTTEKHSVHNSPANQAFFHEPQVEIVQWDDDDETVPTLRKYYALQSEATVTLAESKRQWEDTPFSIFAVQSFDPPADPPGMKALLEHSQKTYGPLPSDLRASRRRSRTLSRPSPYPRSMLKPDDSRPIIDVSIPNITIGSIDAIPLQEIQVNPNVDLLALSPPPALNVKPVSPFVVDFKDRAHQKQVMKENANLGLPVPSARPRVPSNARRSALGRLRRKTKTKRTSSSIHRS
ncbi:hypothetical protein BD410DRAFT_845383 [Rickenella mellea]|uniref:Uncharacterized protein n=1 Tax=Rickenella mellea TaxID=50990 RepID=A0A4Y7PIK7_9AGAM|nr:hypothetical protein BD410DRAFT_845383 [Rickenella mellea]